MFKSIVGSPRKRESRMRKEGCAPAYWIPAFAGMTAEEGTLLQNGNVSLNGDRNLRYE